MPRGTAPLRRPGAPEPAASVDTASFDEARVDTASFDRAGVDTAAVTAKAPTAPRRIDRLPAGGHALVRSDENARLYAFEQKIRARFDALVPTLRQVSALQHEADFESRAQMIAHKELGFSLPADLLADAWVEQLDMRRLYAWCLFETYRRFADGGEANATPALQGEAGFQAWLQDCGFHSLDLSPCADGRLAHVIRYVLRLPPAQVRRKSYAGALFDIEDSLDKWTETELMRFREGTPNTADAPTRYLKAVVYHYSSVDPDHQGCAAHGSDAAKAAQGGLDRLLDFQHAVENSYCCGASIDLLLIGLDTDTDGIRIHLPDAEGRPDLDVSLDALELFGETAGLGAAQGEAHILARVQSAAAGIAPGMAQLITGLLVNNLSQIDYVRRYYNGHYPDTGHAERFIGVGKGFEEVQLRNLTYFAYLDTVEEATRDLDVGIKIFSGLNVAHGLPIPVVVRFDYPGQVPGARERAQQQCARVAEAVHARFTELSERGRLHTLQLVRDTAGGPLQVVGSSLDGLGKLGD